MNARKIAWLLLPLAASCSGGSSLVHVPVARPECNPLVGTDCATPYPSAFFEVADPSSPTGMRLALPAPKAGDPGVLPENTDTPPTPTDPTPLDRADGFSPDQDIVVHFPNGVDPANLPAWKDLTQGIAPTSPVQILDMSGKRVPEFAEVDANAEDPTDRALMIRPMVRLQPSSRYVVVLTTDLVDTVNKKPIPVPPGMQALLDGSPTDDPALEALRPRYQEIFAVTDEAGIARDKILLAWDYTTASDTFIHSHVLAMRDMALAAYGDGSGYSYTVQGVDAGYMGGLVRVHGTFQVPCFLSDDLKGDSVMVTDANGQPKLNGKCDAPFMVFVPAAASTATLPMRAMIYGHGLLGNDLDEPSGTYVRMVAQLLPRVVIAGSWSGLSTPDITQVALAFTNVNDIPRVTDKLQQAIVDAILLVRFAHGKLRMDPNLQVGGKPVLSADPKDTDYYGISLGGIMGNSFMAWDPDVAKGVLGVPGGDWSMMFERSSDWPQDSIPFDGSYPGAVDRQVLLSTLQQLFDFSDPISTAPDILQSPLPGVPKKEILMQEAEHDSQVPNIATETTVRTMGIPELTPTLVPVYGLTQSAGPLDAALTYWDENLMPFPPDTNAVNTVDNGTHGSLRFEPAVLRQISAFLATGGQITYTCSGTTGCACYGTTNACM